MVSIIVFVPCHMFSDLHRVTSVFMDQEVAHNVMMLRGKLLGNQDGDDVLRVLIYPRKKFCGKYTCHVSMPCTFYNC